ncbi:hypothetical protein [Wohlfahrtiimonas chitiniclastica]|uniref:hypothetical protein n=1 Tax=Wohlfahrtiimonas chitiniclastica TaxID=400946 RepID=UPI000B995F69|nr:hypothetical protein [Wohlfahrtiimonas chitiniclastica]OYQ85387.1 hypothetical protein B9T14_02540 [Wohlfahrtiimonas chitiniclastica]OYQ86379.1 hypothetical protein B9T15_02495 [Wohlfahrtiimonas chitiniclastica]
MINIISNITYGVVSGLILVILTSITNYLKKTLEVKKANKELITIIKKLIPENFDLNYDIIYQIANAISIEYKISYQKLYSIDQIKSLLIKNILDSEFISTELKSQYCQKIFNILTPNPEESSLNNSENINKPSTVGKLLFYITILIAGMALLLAIILDYFHIKIPYFSVQNILIVWFSFLILNIISLIIEIIKIMWLVITQNN